MSGGTFMVARSIWDHPEFRPSEFSEREAFLWMVSEASWKPRTKRVGAVVVALERGQLAHSTRFLAETWGWSHGRARRFLERLENRHMIGTQTGTGVTVISLTNYDTYQGAQSETGTAPAHEPAQHRHSTGTNENKGNKGNKEKTYVHPRFEEFWCAFADKRARPAAEKAFAKAAKDTDPDVIIAGAKRYAATRGGERRFWKMAQGWLNDRRWEDAPVEEARVESWMDGMGIRRDEDPSGPCGGAWDTSSPAGRQPADVSAVQPRAAQEVGQVPERDDDRGWRGRPLLALQLVGGGAL